MVDLPDPDSPVRNSTNPRSDRGGRARRSSRATAGGMNQDGTPVPVSSRSASSPSARPVRSVPDSISDSGRHTSAAGS